MKHKEEIGNKLQRKGKTIRKQQNKKQLKRDKRRKVYIFMNYETHTQKHSANHMHTLPTYIQHSKQQKNKTKKKQKM